MDIVDKALYDRVVGAVRAKSINTSQVINIITFAMMVVENYKQLEGSEKIVRVIRVLHAVIEANDIGLPPDVASVLADMLEHDAIIVGFIESIVDATKHINIGGKGGLLSCFACK